MVIGDIYYSVKARTCLTIVEVIYLGRNPGSKPNQLKLRFDDGKIHVSTYEKMKEGISTKRLLYRGQSQSKTAITISSTGTIITLIQE